jgi:hypothetical protein
MAHLFEITGNIAYPNPETLRISPFKEIWERDKSKGKEIALLEFSYIEFMVSVKKSNPFKGYGDDRREAAIMEHVIKDKKWKPDALIVEGMQLIKKIQEEASPTLQLFTSAKNSLNKLRQFLDTVDLTEVNPKTLNPIYKPKDLTSALIDLEKVMTNFNSLGQKVEEELFEETRRKAGKEISPFANPESLKHS